MTSTQQKRIWQLAWDHLKSLSGKAPVTLDIYGPGLVLVPKGPKGVPAPGVGWNVMVTLENQTLINHPTHCVFVPVEAHLPEDETVKQLVTMCWEKCQELELEANRLEAPTDEQAQAIIDHEAARAATPPVMMPKGERKPAGPRTQPIKRARERVSHFPSKPDSGFGPHAESDG